MKIEQRINKWWSSCHGFDDVCLVEGTDYRLGINKSVNNSYTSVLTYKCAAHFKLPFVVPVFFNISVFYRHLREKQCIKLTEVSAYMNDRINAFFFNMIRKIFEMKSSQMKKWNRRKQIP